MPADDSAIASAIHLFDTREEAIAAGGLTKTSEHLDGHSFHKNSAELDCQAWIDLVHAENPDGFVLDDDGKLAAAFARVRLTFDERSLRAALAICEKRREVEWVRRLLVYLACHSKAADARSRLAAIVLGQVTRGTMLAPHRVALAMALAAGNSADSMREYLTLGLVELHRVTAKLERMDAARNATASDAAVDHLVEEDRAEFFSDKEAGAPGEPSAGEQLVHALLGKRKGVVVIPKLPSATGYKREIYNSLSDVAGKRLAILPVQNLAAVRASLIDRWPHAEEVIDAVLRDLAATDRVKLKPTLLVGSPGSGKSALAVALCEALGLPTRVINLGGAADASVGGTSAQWHSARPSVIVQHLHQSRVANPAIVWDEADKASTNRHNGSAFDVLLGMLEPDQAKRYVDPALEVECDLSWVVQLATANDLDTVPAPVKDRMRILLVPAPTWQQIGPMVRRIVDEIQAERNLRAEWQVPFGQDEMDVLAAAWAQSPSFRPLRRVLEDMMARREQLWGRA